MAGKKKKNGEGEQEVRIYSLATTVNECIIFLEEAQGQRLLPIWIGLSEGQAIAIKFSGIALPRPLTHDLILSVFKQFGWKVDRISVVDLKDNTFYAKIYLRKEGEQEVAIDSRPSDAIAVAVRAGCPIFVAEKVFDRCQVLKKPITKDELKSFKEELKNLKPEDIFKDLKGEKAKKEDDEASDEEENKEPSDE